MTISGRRFDQYEEYGVRYKNMDDEPVYISSGGLESAARAMTEGDVLVSRLVTPWRAVNEAQAKVDAMTQPIPGDPEGLTEALEELITHGVGTDLMPTQTGRNDTAWWYDYLNRHEMQWRSRLAALLPREDG